MADEHHDALQCVTQLRQTLSADKLSIGFFLGAGCPCAVRIPNEDGQGDRPIIPDIKGLTVKVRSIIENSGTAKASYNDLMATFSEDGIEEPNIEITLNRIRSFRGVAGKVGVRGLSSSQLDSLDREISQTIREIVTCSLPNQSTAYDALANYIGSQRSPFTEIFTTNYDVLVEQALEKRKVPYFDGFVGSSHPFFDQQAIEDDKLPHRWSRLWKLHGSINWRFNKTTKAIFRSNDTNNGDELLIHPSHLKYDESRRMPYFVMIDRLRGFLRNQGRPVALIVAGYSFGDEHLNEAIIESLKANPSAACFALQFGALGAYPEAIKLAENNANLSLLADDRAVIRRRAGTWIADASIDVASLRGVFELVEQAKVDEGTKTIDETPRACRMCIGDFRRLGDFLTEFSNYGFSGGTGVTP